MTRRAAFPLLRNPAFVRLWFIQGATQVGGNMALYALTILVFETTGSTSAVSVLFSTYVLPQIILSPFAGVVVDRLNLRWALVGPNVLRAVLMVGLALTGRDLLVLLALNLAISCMSVALTPAEGSMIPRVVPRNQLGLAMGIFNLTLQGSFALGFAFLGPILVTVAGSSAVLGVVAGLYVAASIACIGLPSAPPVEASRTDHAGRRCASRSASSRPASGSWPATARSAGRSSTRPPRPRSPASSACWDRRWQRPSACRPITSS